MDISKLRQSQLIVGAAGIVLVISLFLDWVGVSAFSAFSAMDIVMLLVGLAAVGYAALPASGSAQSLPKDSAWIVLLAGVGVVGWALGICLEDADAGIGAWLGLIGSIAIAVGAYVEIRGGNLARPMTPAAGAGLQPDSPPKDEPPAPGPAGEPPAPTPPDAGAPAQSPPPPDAGPTVRLPAAEPPSSTPEAGEPSGPDEP
jgi:hypothetical protein